MGYAAWGPDFGEATFIIFGMYFCWQQVAGCTDSREGPRAMAPSSNTAGDWTHRSISAEPQSPAKPTAPAAVMQGKTGQQAAATTR